MAYKYQTSVFIFCRDFRLQDNQGLLEALSQSETVIPCFFFTPEQVNDKENSFKSDNCVQFMIESLEELDQELKKKGSRLFYFYDSPEKALEKLFKSQSQTQTKSKIDAVFINHDYTPYAKKREENLQKVCQKYQATFHAIDDYLLLPVQSVTTPNGVYKKFTPYFRKASLEKVLSPQVNKYSNSKYFKKQNKIQGCYTGKLSKFYQFNQKLWRKGGRTNALKIIEKDTLIKAQKDYNKTRNDLNLETTNLSAYIKFGCLSIREVYWAFREHLGTKNDLIKQLYWREFYYNLLDAYPHLLGHAMKEKYDKMHWENNPTYFKKWTEGKTGYPIVDAGMRSMNETGFMHNRSRLIVSNFLIKIMYINWEKGEKYFAQTLYDYDPAVNNGNWQWSASTGADSQPYFRVFNPWLQSKKFDPDATYIKKWVPELKNVPAKHLHQWDKYSQEYSDIDYPAPTVDYQKGKAKVQKAYQKIT